MFTKQLRELERQAQVLEQNPQKHISELVSDFQIKLSHRRKELYQILDRLDINDDKEKILYEFTVEEIEKIFKLIKATSKII
jgi:predicted site-specific integrase-resolvase